MDVARCLLDRSALPKLFWRAMTVNAVFLLNHLPKKTIGSNTPYYGMFGKYTDISLCGPLRTLHMGAVKRVLRYLRRSNLTPH